MSRFFESKIFFVLVLVFTFALREASAQREIPKRHHANDPKSYEYKNYTKADTLEAIHEIYEAKRQRITAQTVAASLGAVTVALTQPELFSLTGSLIAVGVFFVIHQLRFSRYKRSKEQAAIAEYESTGQLTKAVQWYIHKYLR